MTPRSDMTLEWHLREVVAEEAGAESVKEAVRAVFTHMHSGRSRQRRGGRELVRLLEEVRAAAASVGEWQVVRLVQDAIEYAEGRITRYDFEDRYRLFADGKRRESHTGSLGSVMKSMHRWLYDSGQEFLMEHPAAGIEDFLEHFRAQGEDALFLQAPEDRPGRYVIPRGRAEITLWLERIIRSGRIDVMDPAAEARKIAASPEALALLAADDQGRILLQAAELRRRAARLKELRTVVEDRTASEADVQRALDGQYWIFGGRFVDEAAHRRLVPGDEVDIPLIRGDGALHVVELKRSMSLKGPLVKRHRDAWVPAAQVHEAVGQAVNYLTGLDENRERIRADFGIETRRASALVLVGHPALHPEVPEDEVNEALRTFNAHLTRVEVLTYKELVDNAERSLAGDGPVLGA
ncbi:Shedu anti-phage system protein SduA domain-containing protein [Streptomyces massasporeus]|uniref:Shedu anti-phage system protein SduA domain-containing protein n=1 Tax=Streptomyces massasporeus TaxID=67324 RepID=UPI0033BD7E5A